MGKRIERLEVKNALLEERLRKHGALESIHSSSSTTALNDLVIDNASELHSRRS